VSNQWLLGRDPIELHVLATKYGVNVSKLRKETSKRFDADIKAKNRTDQQDEIVNQVIE
jgi:hypothetical protein